MTSRQEEYLMLFAQRSANGCCIANASEEFGVSKATVSHLSTALEQMGLILKKDFGSIELTEQGHSYIQPKLERAKKLEAWMVTGLGLAPNLAEHEARRMVVSLREETLEAMIRRWDHGEASQSTQGTDAFFLSLACGVYQLPFQVRKKDRTELSMGDQGFQKPAILVCREDGCDVFLFPRSFQYRTAAAKARRRTGVLERLWYSQGGVWKESLEEESGNRMIPGEALRCEEGADGHLAKVRIRVRARVPVFRMPESEADLVFQLDQLKFCQEEDHVGTQGWGRKR